MDVTAQDELGRRVGAQPALEVGAVDKVAGIGKAGCGYSGRFGQERKMRSDDDKSGAAAESPNLPMY